ncbi:lipid II:glycine glycyltransferase FemX [Halosimplex salinum]|uniref:lipid II:glycine glycyltransferase FemX n=1 Tax=Halosimplex salinum TaxID=1710538 RepID=UPI000F460A6C|nr:GNAT family N-acetyltransferase [Halosimplex salinum]
MSIEISRLTSEAYDEWDRAVERSPETTIFHRSEVLEQLAEYTDAELHLLVGYKGQEPVGVLPLFELEKGPIRAAFSPPPAASVEYLGPARLNMAKLSRRKAERRHQRFLDACFEYVDETINPAITRIDTGPDYDDVRPFQWEGYSVVPEYTYVVELTDEDDLLSRFSSDARGNIRDSYDADFVIEQGRKHALGLIVDQVQRRYRDQDHPVTLPSPFIERLFEALSADEFRPYVCRVDGEFVGGILVVADGDTVYRWIGGVRPERDVDFPVNDLLDWRVMTDAIADGRERYDLVGAGAERVNEYKAKFDPDLMTSYRIHSNPLLFDAVSWAYEHVERRRIDLVGDAGSGPTGLIRSTAANLLDQK